MLCMLMSDSPLDASTEDIWGCQAFTWLSVLRKMDSPSPLALYASPELRPLMELWDAIPTHNAVRLNSN